MRCLILFAVIVLLSAGYCNAYNWKPNVVLPNLADYQGRLDDLNNTLATDPQNVTALETLLTVYSMMTDTANNLKDIPNFNRYFNAETTVQDRIDAANAAKQVNEYQKSLGTTEDELATRINISKARAYTDPLNASAWQELSDAYDAMANYHARDDYSKYEFQKQDADNAAEQAKSIQESNLDTPVYSSFAGNYSTVVVQAANARLKVKEDADRRAAEIHQQA